ncbi:voltage-gated potassium channel [Tindallia magadiensis]|uniref:Voltage-gated potassium channel n=1 Tax=Tindallia magadiensis TaxID=69895 RepID=A0A1I3GIA9_9FIRM|nr:ion transporter [Tindallia magadiensis]SFI23174.1 voltage-gated potassium channel [Tindallia magadiensis]
MTTKEHSWKHKISQIIYQTDTPAGYLFDVLLILSILINSLLIILESVEGIRIAHGQKMINLQYIFVAIFTIEYGLRVYTVENRRAYVMSFFGIIDFLAILPFYLAFIMPIARLFPVLRTLRLLRLFSVFKMVRYVDEAGVLIKALRASRPKIIIFLSTILLIIVIVGALMYTIEGPENGFVDIPESMYWAVVTVSTVGYGDISPQTELGKLIASVLMITGYGIIAVPTGIITSEMSRVSREAEKQENLPLARCPQCGQGKHTQEAMYCYACGVNFHKQDS